MQLLRRGYQPRSAHARSAYQRYLHVTSGHAWLGTDVYSCGRKSGNCFALDCKAHAWRGAWDEWWAVARPPASEPPITIWKALSGVWKLTRGQEFWLVAGLAALVLAAAGELAVPHFVSRVLDAVVTWTSSSEPRPNLATYAPLRGSLIAVMASGLLETVFTTVRAACASMVTLHSLRRLRSTAFAVLMRRDAQWFGRRGHDPVALTTRLAADCDAVARLVSVNANVLIRNGLQAAGGIAYLILLHGQLAAICIATLALVCSVSVRYGRFSRGASMVGRQYLARSSAVAEESLRNIALVKAHGYEQQEQRRYGLQLQDLVELGYRTLTAYSAYMFAHIAFWHGGVAAMLVAGSWYACTGAITAAQLIAFVMYSDHVITAAMTVCEQLVDVGQNLGTVDKVLRLVQDDAAPVARGALVPSEAVWSRGLSIEGLSFAYRRRPHRRVLCDVCLAFRPGEATALVGPSGSGKTTLALALVNVVAPTSGRVCLGPHDVAHIDPDWYSERVAVVPQDPQLFSDTVHNNIAYGRPDTPRAHVVAAARAAHADTFIAALDKGYDTPISGRTLSGGQRQRIAIARAFLRRPRLLVLDEATSALDAVSEGEVQQAITAFLEDPLCTVVLITHRLASAQACSRIVALQHGAVAEQGTHAELMAMGGGVYAGLVARQMEGLAEATAGGGGVREEEEEDEETDDGESSSTEGEGGVGNGSRGPHRRAAPAREASPTRLQPKHGKVPVSDTTLPGSDQ